MRPTEFLINLFSRYSAVEPSSMASLKQELNTGYINIINQMEAKKTRNAPIEKKLEETAKQLDGLDEHNPQYGEKLLEFEKLQRQIENPTIMERVIAFFEKPYVRLALMIGFILASRWIAKKITEKKDDKEELEEEAENQQRFYPNPPPHPYQPWGAYPPPPPPSGYYYPEHQHRGK